MTTLFKFKRRFPRNFDLEPINSNYFGIWKKFMDCGKVMDSINNQFRLLIMAIVPFTAAKWYKKSSFFFLLWKEIEYVCEAHKY